jgi:hypothetical protein
MIIAFLTLSAGYVSLFLAIRSQVPSIWGKVGLIVLVVSAAGMAIAGVFVTDPITTPATERSMSGRLHEVGPGLTSRRSLHPSSHGALPGTIHIGRLPDAPCSGPVGCPFSAW